MGYQRAHSAVIPNMLKYPNKLSIQAPMVMLRQKAQHASSNFIAAQISCQGKLQAESSEAFRSLWTRVLEFVIL